VKRLAVGLSSVLLVAGLAFALFGPAEITQRRNRVSPPTPTESEDYERGEPHYSNPSALDVKACSAFDPPCPPVLPATDQSSSHKIGRIGWVLGPAPEDDPLVTEEQAAAFAWGMSTFGGTEIQPVYALLPRGHGREMDTPVWLVRISGACIQYPTHSPCVPGEWDTLVDAQSGNHIASFNSSI
jgi:hypothetical protein